MKKTSYEDIKSMISSLRAPASGSAAAAAAAQASIEAAITSKPELLPANIKPDLSDEVLMDVLVSPGDNKIVALPITANAFQKVNTGAADVYMSPTTIIISTIPLLGEVVRGPADADPAPPTPPEALFLLQQAINYLTPGDDAKRAVPQLTPDGERPDNDAHLSGQPTTTDTGEKVSQNKPGPADDPNFGGVVPASAPAFIIMKEGESADDAVSRISADHPDKKVVSYEQWLTAST